MQGLWIIDLHSEINNGISNFLLTALARLLLAKDALKTKPYVSTLIDLHHVDHACYFS